MVKRAAAGDLSDLARLLREGRRAKDYSKLLGYLRSLTPSKLDAELRAMQVPPLPLLVQKECCTGAHALLDSSCW